MGYTRIGSEKNGLRADMLFFVPPGDTCEVQRITLSNNGRMPKRIHLFSFV